MVVVLVVLKLLEVSTNQMVMINGGVLVYIFKVNNNMRIWSVNVLKVY